MFYICEIHQNLSMGAGGKGRKAGKADRRRAEEILYKRSGLA